MGQDHVLIYRLDGDYFAVDLEGYGKDRAEMYYQTIRESTGVLYDFFRGSLLSGYG